MQFTFRHKFGNVSNITALMTEAPLKQSYTAILSADTSFLFVG